MPQNLKFIASTAEWRGAIWLRIHQIKIKVQTSHITFCDSKDQIISQSKWFDLKKKEEEYSRNTFNPFFIIYMYINTDL